MYSKNDYRYYLENQLIHSDDFLAHYGVKGMKWRNHKAVNPNIEAAQERGRRDSERWGTYQSNGRTELYRTDIGGRRTTVVTNYKPSRTKRVGTNTNSIRTKFKDIIRRRRNKTKLGVITRSR